MTERAAGARLSRNSHSSHYEIPVRFADLDTQGHVNNVAMVSLLEDARSRFLIEVGISKIQRGGPTTALGGGHLVAVAAQYEYLAEAFYPGTLEVHCAVLTIGRSSFVVTQFAEQGGAPVSACTVVFVMTDGERPTTLHQDVRDVLCSHLLQDSADGLTDIGRA